MDASGRFLDVLGSEKDKPSNAEVMCLMNLHGGKLRPDAIGTERFSAAVRPGNRRAHRARWQAWLKHDPDSHGEYRKALKSLRGIYIDCGWRDQFHIHYGCRLLSKALNKVRVEHRYEEFDDDHSGIDYRMDRSLPFLYRALKP